MFRSALAFTALTTTSAFIGINMGNVLEAPTEGAWAPVAQEYYFDDYVAANFTRVRIPVRWDLHMGTSLPYTIDPTFLARVQTVVSWCLARDLTCLINSQCVVNPRARAPTHSHLLAHSPQPRRLDRICAEFHLRRRSASLRRAVDSGGRCVC